jgi:hypothetical protein
MRWWLAVVILNISARNRGRLDRAVTKMELQLPPASIGMFGFGQTTAA